MHHARWANAGIGDQYWRPTCRPVISLQRCLLSFTISAGVLKRRSMRLKHRSHLKCVSGLTQHALLVDVYAKVLADNLGSLVCQGTAQDADLPSTARTCNRAYAAPCLQRLLPRMALGMGCNRCPLGKGVLTAQWQFARRSAGSKSAASKIPCETTSKLGLQGVMA